MAFTPEQLTVAKAQFPNLKLLSKDGAEVVVRPPSREEWRRFRRMQLDEAKRPESLETLLLDCTVLPSREEIQVLLARQPSLADAFGARVLAFAAGETELQEKNL